MQYWKFSTSFQYIKGLKLSISFSIFLRNIDIECCKLTANCEKSERILYMYKYIDFFL